jgi:hypothetical protein
VTATTVWAATPKVLEGKGGLYLEHCQISHQWEEKNGNYGPGHAAWAYDEAKEEKLWKASLELVGLKDDVLSSTL